MQHYGRIIRNIYRFLLDFHFPPNDLLLQGVYTAMPDRNTSSYLLQLAVLAPARMPSREGALVNSGQPLASNVIFTIFFENPNFDLFLS